MTMYVNEFQTKEKPIQQQQLILLALQILIVHVNRRAFCMRMRESAEQQ